MGRRVPRARGRENKQNSPFFETSGAKPGGATPTSRLSKSFPLAVPEVGPSIRFILVVSEGHIFAKGTPLMGTLESGYEQVSREEVNDLRRAVATLRRALVLLAVILCGLASVAWQKSPTPDVITSRKFVLVNDAGKTVAVLQHTGTGGDFLLSSDDQSSWVRFSTTAPQGTGLYGTANFAMSVTRAPSSKPLPNSFTLDSTLAGAATENGVEFYGRQNWETAVAHGSFSGHRKFLIEAGGNGTGYTTCKPVYPGTTCAPVHP